MRFSNPAMRRWLRSSRGGAMAVETQPATYRGIVGKTVYFALITIIAAVCAVLLLNYVLASQSEELLVGLLIACVVGVVLMIVFSIVIMLAPATVKFLGTLYSLIQGALLGLVVYIIDLMLPGVALAAVLGTMIVFVVTLVMNKFLDARVTNKVFKVLMIAFISLFVVELIMVVVSFFVMTESLLQANFWLQLLVTAFCIVWAAAMLMFDLQAADEIVQNGADCRYEWVVSFSLVTTLVYLYIQILELIIRFAALFSRRK